MKKIHYLLLVIYIILISSMIQGYNLYCTDNTTIRTLDNSEIQIKENSIEALSNLNYIANNDFSEIENSQINISDSLNVINNSDFTIRNSITNFTDFSNNITLSKPNNYSISDISLKLNNIKSETSINDVESDLITTNNFRTTNADDYGYIATSFYIIQEKVNITSISVNYQSMSSPTGNIHLTGISDGYPNNTIIGEVFDLVYSTNDWVTYKYNTPITLTYGNYAVVLEDTTSVGDLNYYKWNYVEDNTNGNQSKMYVHDFTNSSWTVSDGDLLFYYETIEIDNLNSEAKEYLNPEEIDITINSQEISTLGENNIIFPSDFLFITSNTSIIFNMDINISLQSENNFINYSLRYKPDGFQLTTFEVNFTINSIDDQLNYQNISRNIRCSELPNSWNASLIYKNNSIYVLDILNNESIHYTNGSDLLIINILNEINTSSWMITFISESLISNLSVFKNQVEIQQPFVLYSNDTMSIQLVLRDTLINSESMITIKDGIDFQIYQNNFTDSNTSSLSFDNINIEELINQTDENSNPYTISIDFFDNISLNVGKINFDIIIKIQTNLQVFKENLAIITIKSLLGNNFQLEAKYINYHTNIMLNSANITYTTSWGIEGEFSQVYPSANYTSTINTASAVRGAAYILINAELAGYVHVVKNITINFIAPTKVEIMGLNSQVWTNSSTIILQYNNQSTNSIIFYMAFKDDLTDEVLSSPDSLQTNESNDNIDITTTYMTNGTWKITLTPLKISEQRIVIKYNEQNYKEITIILNVSIVEGDLDPLTAPNSGLQILDVIIIVIVTLIIIGAILTSINMLNHRMRSVLQTNAELNKKLSFIKDTYLILISNSSGIPLYHLINEKYSGNAVVEIISGVSTSIDDFLGAFHNDFMKDFNKIHPQQIELNKKEKISISYINRSNFSITILSSLNFRLFVFMEKSSSKEVTRMLKQIGEDLESNIVIDNKKVINSEIYYSQIESIINRTIPTILFKNYAIDIKRLLEINKNLNNDYKDKISKNAVIALKKSVIEKARLNVERSEIYTEITENIDRKKALKIIEKEYLRTPLVFKYEECIENLQKMFKLSLKEVYEALWIAASPELRIIISQKELEIKQ